jgi:hypothetical protein
MRRHLGAVLMVSWILGASSPILADDAAAKAILDKAIKAMGGEEKISKIGMMVHKSKGVLKLNGNDNPFSIESTFQDVSHYRGEFEAKVMDNDVSVVTVLNGDKGWRKINGTSMPMDEETLATTKRTVMIQSLPTLLLPLKGKEYKLETVGEEKIGDAPAAGIKVTTPDGKDFTIFFDKKSGLVVKVVAKVPDFQGGETSQETVFSAFKEFDGLKRPTKIESKRDGQPFMEQEVSEFKVLDKADPKAFEEP